MATTKTACPECHKSYINISKHITKVHLPNIVSLAEDPNMEGDSHLKHWYQLPVMVRYNGVEFEISCITTKIIDGIMETLEGHSDEGLLFRGKKYHFVEVEFNRTLRSVTKLTAFNGTACDVKDCEEFKSLNLGLNRVKLCGKIATPP